MLDWIIWVIIGAVCLIAIIAIIYTIVRLYKMSPEQRKEIIITFLIGLVTAAESAYDSGMGKEKLKEVEDKFNSTAPWFLKIILKLTNCGSLNELIEEALDKAKNITWDKSKK